MYVIVKQGDGRGARIRTRDLLRPRLDQYVYLIDFAARLATQKLPKARQERSSGTDLVLVCLRLHTRVLGLLWLGDLGLYGFAGFVTSFGCTTRIPGDRVKSGPLKVSRLLTP